ncbi:MAG: ADP-ribosylglycohydrolase family protein [Candidatus Shapirobacteria bacterium]|jgi:ADP-ribosylglycohydrolase
MSIPQNYLDRVYAGILGKCIGIRVGAPVEPTIWTYDRIKAAYGDICGYVKHYKNFAADDDFNGPAFFIRALVDYGHERGITARDVGLTWLEYTREEKGFYWWGGVGRSTEHTSYVNLKNGIDAPRSGSIAVNGQAIAEQIGGQIFVDSWGLVYPADPERAAAAARMAASVSHDGEGLNGAAFIAGAISAAFLESEPELIFNAALALIPSDSEYARVVRAVRDFHAREPADFRACMAMLTADFGYDRYPGVCHIIPNAGVCALALLYSTSAVAGRAPESLLSRGVEIATMCGWDTDCNAGNVGTILGVAGGLAGVEDKYRKPMDDFFVCSSAAGSLNIVDLPSFAHFLAALGRREAGVASVADLARVEGSTDIEFDFDLPGSTHGFRTLSNYLRMRNRRLPSAAEGEAVNAGNAGAGCLEVLVDRPMPGALARLYWKPFYRREDFDDERYSPAFSPTALSGQVMRCRLAAERWTGPVDLVVRPYARLTWDKTIIEGAPIALSGGPGWTDMEFTLPDSGGSVIDEIGFTFDTSGTERWFGYLLLDDFSVKGKGSLDVDFSKQVLEFATVTPGAANHGSWKLEGCKLVAASEEGAAGNGTAEFFVGRFHARDQRVCARVIPWQGQGHCVLFRTRGTITGFAAGFTAPGEAAILRNDRGWRSIAAVKFAWEFGKEYRIELEAVGDRALLYVDGQRILEARGIDLSMGMTGLARTSAGACEWLDFFTKEL